MSFSFFKPSRPKTPQEVAQAIEASLLALDTKTVVEVKALEKAMEEIEKNFGTMRCMLSGDGEVEPNADQVLQLALEISEEGVISLVIHKLPILRWEARKDLVHCWSILLKQKVDSTYCYVAYIENNLELLDFLVVCYDNKEIALNCGNMLRECIKFPTLVQYILKSASIVLFFKFVELPNFDVSSDAFSTFKDLHSKHGSLVSEYLTAYYDELLSEFLLETQNSQIMKRYILEVRYLKVMMTLLKDSRKNIQISAFHIFKEISCPKALQILMFKITLSRLKFSLGQIMHWSAAFPKPVFVANPNKPREVKIILAKNHEKLLDLLQNLSGKGAEDEQFEEKKELIIKEIKRVSRLPILQG